MGQFHVYFLYLHVAFHCLIRLPREVEDQVELLAGERRKLMSQLKMKMLTKGLCSTFFDLERVH